MSKVSSLGKNHKCININIVKKHIMSYSKTYEITIKYEIPYASRIPFLFQEGIELRQRLKNHEKKWSTDENIDWFYFGTAIDVAILILDNAQFNIENIKVDGKSFPNATIRFISNSVCIVDKQEKTQQEPKESFDVVFPMLSKLIENILDISESTEISKITEERENQVIDNMNKLIDLARKKDLVDFNKFKPGKDEAWQYTFLTKNLDTIT